MTHNIVRLIATTEEWPGLGGREFVMVTEMLPDADTDTGLKRQTAAQEADIKAMVEVVSIDEDPGIWLRFRTNCSATVVETPDFRFVRPSSIWLNVRIYFRLYGSSTLLNLDEGVIGVG